MIEDLLQPETEIERLIMADESWRTGVLWGTPRYGHPEGMVLLHIREVLDNVDKAAPEPSLLREQLRLITLTHDSFKYLEDRSTPRKLKKHHAYLAYRFAQQYITDEAVLNTILLHDNIYYAWLALNYQRPDAAEKLLRVVYGRLGQDMPLFYLFFKCDTLTGDKTLEPVEWFEATGEGFEIINF